MPAENVTVTAEFEALAEDEFTVTSSGLTNGTVTADKSPAKQDDTITLTVTPNAGYQLSGAPTVTDSNSQTITPSGSGTTYTFTMPAASVTVTATFTAITYSISIGSFTGGTVTASPTTATVGTQVTLTVTPDSGKKLKSLSVNSGAVTVSGSTYTFTMPAADVTVQAEFEADQQGGGGADESISFANEDYTVSVNPDTTNWSDTQWTLDAAEAGTVYFAVEKAAGYTVNVGGADAAKVTQLASGEAAAGALKNNGSLTASDTQAVFAVDTHDLVFEGGTRTFTLGDTAVTLKMEPETTGAAVYTVAADADGVETLTKIWTAGDGQGALQAIEYVDRNAADNTEYLVRVEKDELSLPRIWFVGNGKTDVTLRLRGLDAPRALKFAVLGYDSYHNRSNNTSLLDPTPTYSNNANVSDGFLNIGYSNLKNKITFILDNNIIVKGNYDKDIDTTTPNKPEVYSTLIVVSHNATLVLRKGALITGFYTTLTFNTHCPILVLGNASNNERLASNNGHVRIEGGSITNCTFDTAYTSLIRFGARAPKLSPGCFYMAPSTQENPIVFEGNIINRMAYGTINTTDNPAYILTDYLATGLSLPAN
jgi:hypothetical protein